MILTTDQSRIGLGHFLFSDATQSGTLKLQYLFRHDRTTISGSLFAWDCHANKDSTNGTLEFFDDWELFHFFLSFLCVDCSKCDSGCQPYNTVRLVPIHHRSSPIGSRRLCVRPTHFPHRNDRKQSFQQSFCRIPSRLHYHQFRTFFSLFLFTKSTKKNPPPQPPY